MTLSFYDSLQQLAVTQTHLPLNRRETRLRLKLHQVIGALSGRDALANLQAIGQHPDEQLFWQTWMTAFDDRFLDANGCPKADITEMLEAAIALWEFLPTDPEAALAELLRYHSVEYAPLTTGPDEFDDDLDLDTDSPTPGLLVFDQTVLTNALAEAAIADPHQQAIVRMLYVVSEEAPGDEEPIFMIHYELLWCILSGVLPDPSLAARCFQVFIEHISPDGNLKSQIEATCTLPHLCQALTGSSLSERDTSVIDRLETLLHYTRT
ncbi:hypothetical protein [Trichothermofontia sp.]